MKNKLIKDVSELLIDTILRFLIIIVIVAATKVEDGWLRVAFYTSSLFLIDIIVKAAVKNDRKKRELVSKYNTKQ